MNIYQSLRENIYDSLAAIFPSVQIVQAYANGPEPVPPYIVFDIYSVKQQGREYTSTFANEEGKQQIYSTYSCLVRVEFAAPTHDFRAADLANELYFKVDYTSTQEMFSKNALSYLRKSSIRKIPKKRDTDWWMCHQIDLYFGYQIEARQDINIIETVQITGEYTRPDNTTFQHQTLIP